MVVCVSWHAHVVQKAIKILLCSLAGSSKAPSSGTSGSSLSCRRCSVKARWRWSSTRAGVAETWSRGVYVCEWWFDKYESSLKWQIHFWHLVPIKSHLGWAFELWRWITLHGWVKSIVQSRPVICLREMLKYWYWKWRLWTDLCCQGQIGPQFGSQAFVSIRKPWRHKFSAYCFDPIVTTSAMFIAYCWSPLATASVSDCSFWGQLKVAVQLKNSQA